MKFKVILNYVALLLIIFIVCIYQAYKPIVEGYQSYEDCLQQGYPRDFCLQVPVQAMIPMK